MADKNKTQSEEGRITKNKSISDSLSATREKRKSQTCKVITVKIQSNKLNLNQKEALKMMFVEAKWIKNSMLNYGQENDIFQYIVDKNNILVQNKDKEFEQRSLKHIGSQQIQSVVSEVKQNIFALSKIKNKKKVGRLKFVSEVKSIDLKQFNVTYKIKSKTKMKIQGVPGDVRVNGLEQLPSDCDFANAKLLNKPDGYYVAIVTYVSKTQNKDDFTPGTSIGIDMGVKTNITLSNGRKINVFVEETDRLKTLQRELARRVKGSNNRRRTQMKLRREYEKLNNIKNNAVNQIVSEIKKFEHIYFQDENIVSWKRKSSWANGSRKIQHSVLGRVKDKLRRCERAIMLDRFIPTTQTCVCGTKNKHGLDERIYRCDCGHIEDRDIHAAKMMILFGEGLKIGAERTEFTPVEIGTSVAPCGSKFQSKKQEAAKSLASR